MPTIKSVHNFLETYFIRAFILFPCIVGCNSRHNEAAPIHRVDTVTVVAKTSYAFTSGRTSFDQRKGDTLIINNHDLPPEKRSIEVRGAILTRIGDDSFAVRTSTYYPDLKQLDIKINRHENVGDGSPILYDKFSIPVQ